MIVTLQTLVFFRKSLFSALDRFVRPYYKQLTLGFFDGSGNDLEDDDADDQVFSEYDEEKGVIFYPPMYAQRYATVSDCLLDSCWAGKIEKVVDFGHHDMSFIKYLKEVPGIRCILGVDIETIPLRCSSDLLGGDEYSPKRETPLQVTLFQGNAADPDYRLIGCDAVIAIEMIEHMLPHDLERFIHTVFGFIKPWIVIFTTPNADFNVLFKALEKNGLRRWDHLFEWTREQFNDWSSNIVTRYPNYTVTCKGIGPGPPGTLHYGCCSQLALFVSKEYHKQADLNINALATQLVESGGPLRNNFNNIFDGCWGSGSPETQCMSPSGGSPQMESVQSMTKTLYPEVQSRMTLVFSSTLCNSVPVTDKTFIPETFANRDQTLQCNLDVEVGKSFMMFDCQDYYKVVIPRNGVSHKVYEIEDVYSSQADERGHIWCNINWGENAPYWNQYYKIVREYAYPFETKSEDARILDMVSEEINRLIDTEYDEEFSVDVDRMEIPLSHLMTVLNNITDDIDRVRDLLEWNGYEIVKDVVIHSRLVVDASSVATHDEEWQDNDYSDWDTADVRSQSVSDGSTIAPDQTGRCLRRALDQKVRNLRKMLSFDEDITTELDKVVCRLMKLALHSSTGRQNPPPARWMQCKLLDLLTLTEKAIRRRKKYFIESFPLTIDKKPDLRKQENGVKELVDKYRHIIQPLEKMTNTDDDRTPEVDIEDEFLSTTSNDFTKENEYTVGMSPSLVIPRPVFSTDAFVTPELYAGPNPLERTKAWLAEDRKLEPYLKHDKKYESVSSADTDNSVSMMKHKKSIKKKKISNKNIRESVTVLAKTSSSKTFCKFNFKREYKKHSKTQITKKVARKRSNYNNTVENPDCEYSSADYDSYVAESRRKIEERHTLNMAVTKPIPESFVAICQPVLNAEKRTDSLTASNNDDKSYVVPSCLSATLNSHHINIITQDYKETIALRGTIANDTKQAPEIKRTHGVGNSFDDNDTNICTKHEVSTESVQAQIIFLNDINEPSTSKGIRHNISTDVQCGPDTLATCPLITPTTSAVKIPQVYSTGIQINGVAADCNGKRTNFGTSTQETSCYKTITPRLRTVGIKIKDSDENVCYHTECSTMTVPDFAPKTFATGHSSPLVFSPVSFNGTKFIKPISSTLKIEDIDSGSDFCAPSIASTAKTCSYYTTHSATASNVLMEVLETKEHVIGAESASKRLILSCGPVNVHSYKDTQVAEDVVYQNQWQRYKPNKNTLKKSINYAKSRSTNASVIRTGKEMLKEKKVTSKENIYRKIQEKKEAKLKSKKATQIRNVNLRKVSQDEKCAEVKKPRASKSIVKMSNKGIPRPTKMITKMASKHAISENTAKNAKSTFTIKRSGISVNVNTKKEIDKPQKPKKSYIPLYLKRALNKDKLNKSLDSATDAILDSKKTLKVADKIAPLKRSNTGEIKRDLLKFGDDLHVNMSYVVCRNDVEDKIKTPDDQASENSNSKPFDILKRSHSPSHSVNSSTCSSPNSIATVRAASARAKATTKKHSAQAYKVNVTNSESDNPSPPRIKKVVKRYKAAKKSENKDMGNKENVPESTKNFVNKDNEKNIKASFAGGTKSICIAQVGKECSSPPLTQKAHLISNKSNVKIPSRKDSDEKRRANSPSISKKLKSKTSSIYDDFIQNESESFKTSDSSNMVLVLEPQQNYENLTKATNVSRKSSTQIAIQSNYTLLDELVNESSLHSNTSTILDSMRHILEETLDRVVTSHLQLHCNSQHTVVLSCDDVQKADFDEVTSPGMKTSINPVEDGQSDPNTLNRTFDSILGGESTVSLNDTRLTGTDLDLLSFKSITSDSKYSEYYLADNEFNTSQEVDQEQTQDTMSVQDIFERKEPHLMQSKPGALAIQAFSGFSLDAEPVAGDQPDSIAIVDSETGSMAVEFNRQATSEELFISSRSSESYGSCVLDDDTVVPNWLFELISHQQSVEEEEMLDPLAEPFDEPHYDGNGNVVEPSLFGVAAGAGDGRGMHSDHSQDSSGRGTSLSSSDTSSGLQSDISTVLIDLSPQMEQLRDPMTSSGVAPMIEHPHFLDRSYEIEGGPGSLTMSGSRDTRRTLTGVSDIDADISSIDTDAPESF